MVYVLMNVQNGDKFILGPNRTYTLGRSRLNNIHLKDITADKMHATLKLTLSSVEIQDKGSKYGTWVNKRKIDEPFKLQNNDVIVFGKKNLKYVLLESKFKAVIDKSVSKSQKCMLTGTLNELNISLMDSRIRDCSHYVIESISLDVLKEQTTLYYLIERKTVITPKYFVDILENIKEAPLMPNIYRYMPDIDDNLKCKEIENINPRKNRKYIFDNVIFIFFNGNCFEDLNDLIIKCGGDTILYRQSANFISDLFRDLNRYKYIAVNHLADEIKSPQYCCFLRDIKQKKKKVSNIFVDYIYISILKGDLVGINDQESLNEKDRAADPQPSTSKAGKSDYDIISSSDDDITCAIVKSTLSNANKELHPLKTFSGLAMAYKETFIQNLAKSPTLSKWITKGKKKNQTSANPVEDSCKKTDHDKNKKSARQRLMDLLTDDESEDASAQPPAKDSQPTDQNKTSSNKLTNDDSISTNGPSPPKKIKTNSGPLRAETKTVATNGLDSSKTHQPLEKRKTVVINPFAVEKTINRPKESQNSQKRETWQNRYKNVEIISTT